MSEDDPNVPLTENPVHIKGAGGVPRSTQIHPAPLDELAVITAAMPDELRLAVQVGAWCALRYGEVFELRRKDIDTVAGVVHVRRGVVWTKGMVTNDRPKTSAGVRDVTIPPHLMPMVTDHLERHVEKRREGLLFYDRHGRNLRPADFQGVWHAARSAAGRDDLKFHHLRHTGAVLAAQSGATLADLMGRPGHTTPAMAMIYQHTAADRDRLIADRLSQIALGNQSPLRVKASRSAAKPRRARSTDLDQPTLLDDDALAHIHLSGCEQFHERALHGLQSVAFEGWCTKYSCELGFQQRNAQGHDGQDQRKRRVVRCVVSAVKAGTGGEHLVEQCASSGRVF
jgi:hypothetical protein